MGKIMDKVRALAPEGTARIEISYYGSGDSFGEFNETTLLTADGGCVMDGEKFAKLKEDISEDDLWKVLEGSDADFNNDGSEGTIIFDLVEGTITVQNNYIVRSSSPDSPYTFEDKDED